MGTRTVHWMSETGRRRFHLSENLVLKELSTSLLSVPALVKNNIGVMFLPGMAVLIYLKDHCKVLGKALQDPNEVFYIDE